MKKSAQKRKENSAGLPAMDRAWPTTGWATGQEDGQRGTKKAREQSVLVVASVVATHQQALFGLGSPLP